MGEDVVDASGVAEEADAGDGGEDAAAGSMPRQSVMCFPLPGQR